MRRHLLVWELAGVVFTVMAGALLHFVFEWSGGSPLAAAFSAVNESTWEHMKLLFFPMFLFSAVQAGFLGRTYPNILAVRAVSTLVGVILIPVLFYTYTGVLGYHVMWADIAVFDEISDLVSQDLACGGRIVVIYEAYPDQWREYFSERTSVYTVRIQLIGSEKYRDVSMVFDFYCRESP